MSDADPETEAVSDPDTGTASGDASRGERVLAGPSRRVKRLLHAAVAVAVPAAITWFVVDNWDELVAGPWDLRPAYLVAAGVLLLAAEGIAPVAWSSLMRAAKTPAPARQVWFVWFAVEPLKYLPVPIGPVLGRYALADRVGLEPFTAVVTLAYDFVIASAVGFAVVFPGLVWLAFAVDPAYQWTLAVVAAVMLLMLWGMLRRGGLARLLADALGREPHLGGTHLDFPRSALRYPAGVTLVMLVLRITANGSVLAAITPIDTAWIPLYGLVFAVGALVPFSRFGAREGAIVIGLGALEIASGPALLAALLARFMGLAASLLWLGASAVAGGARRAEPASGPEAPET